MTQEQNQNVKWSVFIGVIGLFIIVFGWVFAREENLSNRINTTNQDISELRIDIGTIKNDVLWIRQIIETNNMFTNAGKIKSEVKK